jgi:AcrR family transcriptional regulator
MEKLARKEREFKIRRMEILEQAEKIFAAKGFHNVTMAEIASASGFSIGSLYQFFEGKENLYTTMLLEKLDLMYAQIREAVNKAKDTPAKIDALVNAHFRFVEQNRDFCRLFLRSESAAVSDVMISLQQKLINDYLQQIKFIENYLKSGVKSGYLRPLPVNSMARALFGLIRATAIDWMISPTEESLTTQKDFIMELFLRGLKQNEA